MVVGSVEVFYDGKMSPGKNSEPHRYDDPAQRPDQNNKNIAL